jgi:carbamoyltransferase
MSRVFGIRHPRLPALGALGQRASLPLIRAASRRWHLHAPDGDFARERGAALQDKLRRGEPVYLLGLTTASHNAGAALVRASSEQGLELLCNHEEERFSGVKHDASYPQGALEALRQTLREHELGPEDLHCCLLGWDFTALLAYMGRTFLEELPGSLRALHLRRYQLMPMTRVHELPFTAARLGEQLGRGGPLPLIGMAHHANHAAFAYAVSPFARSSEPVAISVIDGVGDDGPLSLYLGRGGRLEQLRGGQSLFDSLGGLYAMLSSTQGGWPPLISEGRYMGAAAWGDGDLLTNPYYRQLRQIIHLGPEGQVSLNRALVRGERWGSRALYAPELERLLGPPIPPEQMWNPDAVLSLDDVRHVEATRERLDKAAACQLVFEDALFHVVDQLLLRTGASRLVMAGGTALNCVASMRLLERFDEAYYARHHKRTGTRLQLWIPPTPGDAGVAMGAAYQFALLHGARPGPPLRHAFYCGPDYAASDVLQAMARAPEINHLAVGEVASEAGRERVADLLAFLVSRGAVIGLFQGVAETGPRALGHRSILADPRNPETLALLNQRVKFREPFRPLAPMLTLEAARELFELSPGAAANGYNAYCFMVLTARARPEARARVPAVVHEDGTARLQIVHEQEDPFTYAYLRAMGRRAGAEVSVNTSLNVGSPIAQTPAQALAALERSHGMDGVLFLAKEGTALLAWHAVEREQKDGGRRLRSLLEEWHSSMAQPGA